MIKPSRIALPAIASVLVLAVAGCGSDDEAKTTGEKKTGSTATEKTATNAGAELTPAQEKALKGTRKQAKALAECLRAAGAKVSTEANDVKDQSIRTPDGVVLRLTWKGAKADIAVLASTKGADELAADVDRNRLEAEQNVVVIFDKTVKDSVASDIKKCYKVL